MAIAASFIYGALQDAQSPMDAMIGSDEGILEPDDLAGCSIPLIFEKLEPGTVTLPHPPNTGEHDAITASPVRYWQSCAIRRAPGPAWSIAATRIEAGSWRARGGPLCDHAR